MQIRINAGVNIELNPAKAYGGNEPIGEDRSGPKRLVSGVVDVDEQIGEYLIEKGHAVKVDTSLAEAPVEPALEETSLEDLDYRDLQSLAKEHELTATGTKDELIKRLSEHLE